MCVCVRMCGWHYYTYVWDLMSQTFVGADSVTKHPTVQITTILFFDGSSKDGIPNYLCYQESETHMRACH